GPPSGHSCARLALPRVGDLDAALQRRAAGLDGPLDVGADTARVLDRDRPVLDVDLAAGVVRAVVAELPAVVGGDRRRDRPAAVGGGGGGAERYGRVGRRDGRGGVAGEHRRRVVAARHRHRGLAGGGVLAVVDEERHLGIARRVGPGGILADQQRRAFGVVRAAVDQGVGAALVGGGGDRDVLADRHGRLVRRRGHGDLEDVVVPAGGQEGRGGEG